MYLINEENKKLKLEDVVANLGNLDDVPTPTLDELQDVLGSYYHEALQKEASKYQFALAGNLNISVLGWGKKLWDLVRKALCSLLSGTSTISDITAAVLSALSKFIPGGWILDTAVKYLVKYFISHGYGALCPAN